MRRECPPADASKPPCWIFCVCHVRVGIDAAGDGTFVFYDGHSHPFPEAAGWHAPAGRRTREPRPLAQDGQIGPAPPAGATKTWDPADESLAGQPERASADSEVRPGPRPPTLRPHHRKTTEAGPKALKPSSLPILAYWLSRLADGWR